MKIVHISLCGPVTDGWNYQENIIPKYQVMVGNDVTVIASKWIFNSKGELEYLDKTDYVYNGVKMIRLDLSLGRSVYSKIKKYRELYKHLEAEEPKIIFIHNVSFVDISEIVRYAKKHKVKIFADNHSDFSNSGRGWISKNILHGIIWRHYARKINPYVIRFYGVLPARVDFLIDVYRLPKDKCELLVMGADDEKVSDAFNSNARNEIRSQYHIEEDDFLIMTGGKIDAWKTQTLLLMEAVNKIYDNKVKLIVFGSVVPELQDKINSLCNGNKVQYIGWVQSEQTYRYFAAADLVVFPGRHSVFWEQVAGMGIPMVCKYWQGTTHVDRDGNVEFLYQDSSDEILDCLCSIYNDSEKFNHMKEAAKDAMRFFSYNNIAKRSIE